MSLFLRVANGLAEASARRANKIKAYHGSPHSFDRFSTDAIGTGEGAQAYSRGLYFAEREATALSYRDALTPRDLDYEEDLMRKYNAAESNGDYARMEMLERAMTHDTPSDFRDLASDTDYDEDYRQLASDMADEIESTGTNFGSMYEVEIDVEDADLLNWDVPLDEQPQKVQDALRKTDWYEDAEARVYESAGNRGDNPYGADLLRDLEEDGPEYAAEALREAGIQGVKYADALTRFSKNKTNNYVIFNDEYVDIARKYGIGAASTLGATAALSPQDAEAGVIRNVAGDLFDLSKLDDVPDVPQAALERYEPKKGMPSNLEPLLTDETAKRLEGYAREGEKAGGRGWYNLEPLREKFMEEHGETEGTKLFNSYLDKVAATSPRSNVATNIRRASHLDILDRKGQQFGGLTNKDMPPGYGHIAHNTHDYSLRDLQQDGSFAALNRPKTSSFAENLKGNQAPMTIDTHNFAAVKNSMEKKSPAKTQYKYLEDFQSEIADKIGMTPAQFQASVWMGGGTGVADARPFMEVFDDVVARTAERNGVTKKKALSGFIKGDSALYDLGPVMLAGGIALNSMPKGQKDQPSYIDQVYDRGAGILDAGANMVSGAVAPIIQGLQHFDAMGTPNADGSTKSLAQLKAQEIELDEMLNYDLRTERGQQITDRMLQGVADTVIPAVGALDEGLRHVDNFLPGQPYQQAKDSAGALHNWYNKQDEKTRMHLGKLMDILP